ncbi:MAG: carboxypeptidase-like regulatory domain-containing protein [Bryobacteraceae bacterium]
MIRDEHGPVVKASVEVRNTMNGHVLRVQSDASGHYQVASLPQGRYSLWVKAPEHDSEWIPEVVVDQGRMTHRDIHLGSPPSNPLPTGE